MRFWKKKIDEHKKTSKKYYSHLELNIIKESDKWINDIENTSNYLNKKVIEILSVINSSIK